MSTQPYFEAVARQMPQARYVLPDFEERTAYGFRRQNPYTKLFEDRIVFLGVQVDGEVAAASIRQRGIPAEVTDYVVRFPKGAQPSAYELVDMVRQMRPTVYIERLGSV